MISLSTDPRAGVKTTDTGLRNIHRRGGPEGRLFLSVQLCDPEGHTARRFRLLLPEGVTVARAVMARDTVLKAVEGGMVPNWESLELLRKMVVARLDALMAADLKSSV